MLLAEEGQEKANDDAPENNPQYTTVYVGNLAPEASIVSSNFKFVCSSLIQLIQTFGCVK